MFKPLMLAKEFHKCPEPFNHCMYFAEGDKVEFPSTTAPADMFAAFARECFVRYEEGFEIRDQWSEVYGCWDCNGNVVAILAVFDSFAKYSPATKEPE